MSRRAWAGRPGSPGRTLLVAGDTLHAVDANGRYYTHSALARQLDEWFAEFDHVVIAAVLRTDGAIPTGFSSYTTADITFVALSKAGGTGIVAKLGALEASISWMRALMPLLRGADVVHLRAPCNVTLVAIPLARLLSRRRYAIYAGAWDPPKGGPISYTFQRWMLRHFGGIVHVYAPLSEGLAPNLRPNFSPTFTAARLVELADASARRLERIRSRPPQSTVLRVCCVGRFTDNKNQVALIHAAAQLRDQGVPIAVRLAGAGESESQIRSLITELRLDQNVTLLGRCTEEQVTALYEWADVNVMPSFVEGFGRVVLEGMAVGCPAVCGPGSMQRVLVGNGSRGCQVDPPHADLIAGSLRQLSEQSVGDWTTMASDCRAFAAAHTIEAFGEDVRDILTSLR